MAPFAAPFAWILLLGGSTPWRNGHHQINSLSDSTTTGSNVVGHPSTKLPVLNPTASVNSLTHNGRRAEGASVGRPPGFLLYQFEHVEINQPMHPGPLTYQSSHVGSDQQTYPDIVAYTLSDVYRIIATVIDILQHQDPVDPTDPSFLRYFFPENLQTVKDVLESLLTAIIGGSLRNPHRKDGTDVIQLINIYYLDPLILSNSDGVPQYSYNAYPLCRRGEAVAYVWTPFNVDRAPQPYGLALCQPFFDTWHPLSKVNPSTFSTVIETEYEAIARVGASSPGARILLHELLHYSPLYTNISEQITDVQMVNPHTGQIRSAYGPYFAIKVKTWPSPQGHMNDLTLNADNYVLMALEIYYRGTYDLPEWQDPTPPLDSIDLLSTYAPVNET